MKRIAVTSDLHGNLPEIEPCDILCICGDIMPLNIQFRDIESKKWLVDTFIPWFKSQPVKNIVLVGGNHDWWLYWHRKEDLRTWFQEQGVIYLKDETALVEGISIHGTPWCKQFGNWAFMRDYQELAQKYEAIPENVDILLSHDAPMIELFGSILDKEITKEPAECGNIELAKIIESKRPKYAFCGHIHSADHKMRQVNGTYLANVSYVNERYDPEYPILYFNYEA